jgi:branched-chain amino acid transport system permease protein
MTTLKPSAPVPPVQQATPSRTRVSGRPMLYTSYRSEMALLNTGTKRTMLGILLVVGVVMPLLVSDADLQNLSKALITAVGVVGLGLVTGYAGQVSLGHAFFLGIGAYTAAVLGGQPGQRQYGLGISEVLVWLPAAGIAAAVFGVLVAPLATRLRGLYLAIVTLGLVFVGGYVFSEWRQLTGGRDLGRTMPQPTLFGYPLGTTDGSFTRDQKLYWLMFAVLLVAAFAARNLVRSRIGRAFTAIRDRDIAAGVMGVNLNRYKMLAFAVSSFYAGCCGALLYVVPGYLVPNTAFGLDVSVMFIAMLLVGGVGTITGAILGAFFFTYLPIVTRLIPDGIGFISANSAQTPNVYQLEGVLYGALLVLFLIFEPRGLFGIWLRLRNYWKAWPFSY